MRQLALLIIALTIIMVIGCSSGSKTPVDPLQSDPDIPNALSPDISETNHSLQGVYTAVFDLENLTAQVIPDRDAESHLNVRTLIPAPYIAVTGWDPVTSIIKVNVTISNPYVITGYDVRLIIYTDSVGHLLVNDDNWTALYDIPGGGSINPFKAYAKSVTERRFIGPVNHTESLQIKLPGGNPNVNFAIDASYPSHCEEPYLMDRFELFEIIYDQVGSSSLMTVGVYDWNASVTPDVQISCPEVIGATPLQLATTNDVEFRGTVVNNMGAPAGNYLAMITASTGFPVVLYEVVTLPVIELPIHGWAKKFPNDQFIPGIETDQYGYVYFALNPTHRLVKYNDVPQEIWQRDIDSLGNFGDINDIDVNSTLDGFMHATGIARYCGDADFLAACSIKSSKSPTGTSYFNYDCYYQTLESFDITSDGMENSYVSSGSPYGGEYWEITKFYDDMDVAWNINFMDTDGDLVFEDLYFSSFGTIYGSGYYYGTVVDINPSASQYLMEVSGAQDAFVAEYNASSGGFNIARHWGGNNSYLAQVTASYMAADSNNNLFVTGAFAGDVDFDPGAGVTVKSSNINYFDVYVSKFNSGLTFNKVIHLVGATDTDFPTGIDIDSLGNVYISGSFGDTVDFDPGPGEVLKTAVASSDVFLAKYTNQLELIWVRTWGNTGHDYAGDCAVDKTTNCVYTTGSFTGTMDFNPGPGVYEMTTSNNTAYIIKLRSDGYW